MAELRAQAGHDAGSHGGGPLAQNPKPSYIHMYICIYNVTIYLHMYMSMVEGMGP